MKSLIKVLLRIVIMGSLISGVAFGARKSPNEVSKKDKKAHQNPVSKKKGRTAKKTEKEALPKLAEVVTRHQSFSLVGPKGWQCISDKTQLPAKIEVVYIGTGKAGFTPSVNIATEETKLPLNEYVALAKQYHESNGDTKCSSLGSIETKSGQALILQIDRKTQWGPVRFLQAALIKEGKAYVLTATCLQDEFLTHYPDFFRAIQTLEIYNAPEHT